MKTFHQIFFSDSSNLHHLADESINLVVTSPPYPMIAMWDRLFTEGNPDIQAALDRHDGYAAFTMMHDILNLTWAEVIRVLRTGGIICINIGDATRKVGDGFSLFSNHSSIIQYFIRNGLSMLPSVIWRKQSNKPNKFMGSGMLPPNAYVTHEHEHILIFRKGRTRVFSDQQKDRRNQSAIFWEERNDWFSDVWGDIRGSSQMLRGFEAYDELRSRSAAYPVQIPLRLIQMYSIHGDTVLDPFTGTGTTSIAALLTGRNSVGYEKEADFNQIIRNGLLNCVSYGREYADGRLEAHDSFMEKRRNEGKEAKYRSERYQCYVVTGQERGILIPRLSKVTEHGEGGYEGTYDEPMVCSPSRQVRQQLIS